MFTNFEEMIGAKFFLCGCQTTVFSGAYQASHHRGEVEFMFFCTFLGLNVLTKSSFITNIIMRKPLVLKIHLKNKVSCIN